MGHFIQSCWGVKWSAKEYKVAPRPCRVGQHFSMNYLRLIRRLMSVSRLRKLWRECDILGANAAQNSKEGVISAVDFKLACLFWDEAACLLVSTVPHVSIPCSAMYSDPHFEWENDIKIVGFIIHHCWNWNASEFDGDLNNRMFSLKNNGFVYIPSTWSISF